MAARGINDRQALLVLCLVLALWGICVSVAQAAELPSTISSNTTLTEAGGPYTGNSVKVSAGVTLTVQPGTVVKLKGSLWIIGTFNVEGTAEKPVYFTSYADDSAGGDTNGDGTASKPAAGDWSGLELASSAEGSINHAVIRFAGPGPWSNAVTYACPCADPPSLNDSVVSKSGGTGIKVTSGDPEITGSTITESAGVGIYVVNGSPLIEDNEISNNTNGILFEVGKNIHSDVAINDNIVESNSQDGIWVSAPGGYNYIDSASLGGNEVKKNGKRAIVYEAFPNSEEIAGLANNPVPSNITTNVLAENAKNGIWVGGTIKEDQLWTDPGYALVIFSNGLEISKATTLTLGQGVTIKGESPPITVSGTLEALGISGAPITFTSLKDDSVEGDTNGDGSFTSPGRGDWLGLRFTKGSGGPGVSTLSHADIRYGGEQYSPFTPLIDIACPCVTAPEIVDSTISNSYTVGLRIREGSPLVRGNLVTTNGGTGIYVVNGSPLIEDNEISNNTNGILFEVGKNIHSDVAINDNIVESNSQDGIWVSAPGGYNYIDSASLGGNEVKKNGKRAIVYEAFPNSEEIAGLANDPVPSNITTNVLAENAKNGIWVGGSIKEDQLWRDSGYALVLTSNGLEINAEATLSLGNDITIKSEGPPITVIGTLHPSGDGEHPVTFTSIKDDSIAGDTNGDGEATVASAGDWKGIDYPSADGATLENAGFRYAEAALDIEYLDAFVITDSDFVHNVRAVDVAETAANNPELAGLVCVPPYLSVVLGEHLWFGPFGLPAPSLDLSSAVGAALPEGYAALFGPGLALGAEVQPNYKGENMIPFSIYSCPPLGIPPVPVTPVVLASPALLRNFPGP